MSDNHRGTAKLNVSDIMLLGHCDVVICILSQGSLRHMQI